MSVGTTITNLQREKNPKTEALGNKKIVQDHIASKCQKRNSNSVPLPPKNELLNTIMPILISQMSKASLCGEIVTGTKNGQTHRQ